MFHKVSDKRRGNNHIPYHKTLPIDKKFTVPEVPEEEEEKEIIKNAINKPKIPYQNPNFNKDQRFQPADHHSNTKNIGPGLYFDAQKNQFFKKTFNINFIEK